MNLFDLGIIGLKQVDPKDLVEYEREIEKAISQIIRDVQQLQILAIESRNGREASK